MDNWGEIKIAYQVARLGTVSGGREMISAEPTASLAPPHGQSGLVAAVRGTLHRCRLCGQTVR